MGRMATDRDQGLFEAVVSVAAGLELTSTLRRIVQAAVKRVIEPIFEREFLPTSYGFRPGRGCKDALREVDRLLRAGFTHVVDADLKSYLDRSSHYASVCGVGAEEIGRSGR